MPYKYLSQLQNQSNITEFFQTRLHSFVFFSYVVNIFLIIIFEYLLSLAFDYWLLDSPFWHSQIPQNYFQQFMQLNLLDGIGTAFKFVFSGLLGMIINFLLMLLLIYFCYKLLLGVFLYFSTTIIIADNKLSIKQGIINSKVNNIMLDRLDSYTMQQSLLGRLFNYADFKFVNNNEILPVKFVKQPHNFYRHISNINYQ